MFIFQKSKWPQHYNQRIDVIFFFSQQKIILTKHFQVCHHQHYQICKNCSNVLKKRECSNRICYFLAIFETVKTLLIAVADHDPAQMGPIVDVIKLFFGGNLEKSRFPPKQKQQEQTIFEQKNSVEYSLAENNIVLMFLCRFNCQNKCYSISKFCGNLNFLQKSFITSTTGKSLRLTSSDFFGIFRKIAKFEGRKKVKFYRNPLGLEILELHFFNKYFWEARRPRTDAIKHFSVNLHCIRYKLVFK